MWKSVRGLSLQEGALLSVLLRRVWFSCGLVEPLAEAGTSLKICKSQTQPLPAHADMLVHVSFIPKRANYGHEGVFKRPSPFPSVFFSSRRLKSKQLSISVLPFIPPGSVHVWSRRSCEADVFHFIQTKKRDSYVFICTMAGRDDKQSNLSVAMVATISSLAFI